MRSRDELGVKERSLNGGSGRRGRGVRSRSRSRGGSRGRGRSRIWHVKELGISCRPCLLGVSLDGVLGKRKVFGKPGPFECGAARVLTPWQGMMRSKSHPATVLASFAITLRKAEIRNRCMNVRKRKIRTPCSYSHSRRSSCGTPCRD